jgi:hypothetical protein
MLLAQLLDLTVLGLQQVLHLGVHAAAAAAATATSPLVKAFYTAM